MSCHFVFREAWLINFNRWFLLAFTHPYSGLCYFFFLLFILCMLFPFLAVLSSNGQTQQSYWFTFTSDVAEGGGSDCGRLLRKGKCEHWIQSKTIRISVVNQCTLIWFQCRFEPVWDLAWLGLRKGTQLSTVCTDYPIVSRLRADSHGLSVEHIFSNMSGQAYAVWRKTHYDWILRLIPPTCNVHLETEGEE